MLPSHRVLRCHLLVIIVIVRVEVAKKGELRSDWQHLRSHLPISLNAADPYLHDQTGAVRLGKLQRRSMPSMYQDILSSLDMVLGILRGRFCAAIGGRHFGSCSPMELFSQRGRSVKHHHSSCLYELLA